MLPIYKYLDSENSNLNFKFISSLILLSIVSIYTIIYDTGINAVLWLCMWCICIVRFVDAIDEISKEDD